MLIHYSEFTLVLELCNITIESMCKKHCYVESSQGGFHFNP